jgi:succinyl-CoA synthetase alpha subunit
MIPVYDNVQDCTKTNKVWGIVLLVSQRNVRRVTEEVLREGIKHIFILAENVPERDARVIRAYAKEHNARIIGPASVGALYVGELKVGHAGGLIENLTRQDLLTKGDVAVVSKSGGMLNELMSVVRRSGRYVHTAIALGGDRFPATPLVEMVEELSKEKSIHTILVLGETGGTQENELAAWLRTSKISQKVVVHILGVGGKGFEKPIQFGHAGAMANTEEETPFSSKTALFSSIKKPATATCLVAR